VGAHESDKTAPNISMELFLYLLRFDQRGKLEELPFEIIRKVWVRVQYCSQKTLDMPIECFFSLRF